MDFGTVTQGLVQGALGGIDLTNRYNQMRALSDETDIRRAQAQALKAPFDPEKDWAGEFQQLPPETQQFFREGIKKYGATRMGMMNTMKDYSDKESLMTQLMDAKLKKAQMDFSGKYDAVEKARAQGLPTEDLEKDLAASAHAAMDIGTKAKLYVENRKIADFYKNAPPDVQETLKPYITSGDWEGVKDIMGKIQAAKIENQKHERNIEDQQNLAIFKQGLKGEGAVGSSFETGANYDRLIKAKEIYENNPTADNLMIAQDLAGKLGYEYSPTKRYYHKEFLGVPVPGTKSTETNYELKRASKGGIPNMPGKASEIFSSAFGKDAEIMFRIARAESGLRNVPSQPNKNGTKDWGIFQINDIHKTDLIKAGIIKSDMNELLDPQKNFMAAQFLYKSQGLKPWYSSIEKWGGGRKLLGWSQGRPVFDSGNGRWEII